MMLCRYLSFLVLPLLAFSQPSGILEDWKKDQALLNASYGFCILDAKTSLVISEYNSHLALVPASTLKIFSTAAALSALGDKYRYETKIYYSGTLDKSSGILSGDLIIVGGGDPTLQSGYFSKESVTEKWAAVIKEKGIKQINGSIIGDGSLFPRFIPGSWLWEDVGNYFGAAPCGLNYMDNKFQVKFSSKETGSSASITGTTPNYLNQPYKLSTDVVSKGTEDEAYVYGDPFSFERRIIGTIPPNKNSYEIEAALPDPALLCAEHLCTALLKLGVKCDPRKTASTYEKRNSPDKITLLYTHYSPSLDKIIFFTNQNSDNLYCESLLRSLGKGEAQAGLLYIKNFISKNKLDTTEIFMKDASGLSRVNSCTPFLQAGMLSRIYGDSSLYTVFNRSLPVAGKNGTMGNMGKGTFIENNLRAKTGYMQRVRAYCGYFRTRSGRDLAFSLMLNNYNCSAREAKLKIEKFLVALEDL
jgi:D-alanyl-D-alanine carboxypeptidase/D-alanyl-D-alanine-endopeptidase (penicillin-binding protein 4)